MGGDGFGGGGGSDRGGGGVDGDEVGHASEVHRKGLYDTKQQGDSCTTALSFETKGW